MLAQQWVRQLLQGTIGVRGGKGWACQWLVPRRPSAMGMSVHIRVLPTARPWFFLEEI
jgi:hypothetical protein